MLAQRLVPWDRRHAESESHQSIPDVLRSALTESGLVGRRQGDLVDDDAFSGAFGGPEFEAKLFLEHREEGWDGRVRSFFGSPFDLEVEVALKACMVLDGPA